MIVILHAVSYPTTVTMPMESSADSSDREGVRNYEIRSWQGLIPPQDTFEDAPDSASRPQSRHSSTSARSLTGRLPSLPSTPRVSDPHTEDVPAKSPLLTAHRISATSLDEVQLDGSNDSSSIKSGSTATNMTNLAGSPPRLPLRSQGLSGNLPSIPWGPPPLMNKSNGPTPTPSPAPAPKKLGMSFSWLSRSTSANKESAPAPSQPPIPHDRRNTVTSVASVGSNPELMLSKLDEGNEDESSTAGAKRQRNSLRDRFKMLRMREEAGIQSFEGQEPGSPVVSGGALAGMIGRSASLGLSIGSPTSVVDEKEGGLAGSPLHSPVSTGPQPNSIPSTTDPSLAPGTASGLSAGPSAMTDPAAPVDWDLWQSVVYEGPSAVARTSAEELSRAIASGIPSAIRGVVWQVLAQSKNDELEGVYRELIVRGTDKDRDHIAAPNGHQSGNSLMNGGAKEKHSVASSASSVHSGHSTPATSATNGLTSPSPSQEKDMESIMKLQSKMIAERKKKVKEDAAALQKLEKVIKKDLGARTSYSKYAVAAGLQEGLFGVCKAYALFDEGVGYAQGMNFLVMPLLFNVRSSGRQTIIFS